MNDLALSPMQLGWLAVESRAGPMHVGVLLYFKKPNKQPGFVGDLVEYWSQCTDVAEPWNQRLSRAGGSARRWRRDETLDLDYHLRHSALPRPGGERELGELVSRLHGNILDRSRPLWECHLIDGLYGDRFAIYLKVHVALLPAPDLIASLRSFLSESVSKNQGPPLWQQAIRIHPPQQGALSEWPAMLKPVASRLREAIGGSLPWAGLRRAPRSALNDRINALRRFATQEYPQARLQAVADTVGASQEELLYYLCGSAVRRFFREYNALPDEPLIALIPDRSRVDGQLCPLLISLGTQHASRGKRLQDIRESLRVARGLVWARSPRQARAEAAAEVMPYIVRQLGGFDHQLQPMFNLGMAHFNVAAKPLFCGQAELLSVFPMPMLLQGGALSIASASYADKVQVGLCGARDNLPHLQRIAVYMEAALSELESEGLSDE